MSKRVFEHPQEEANGPQYWRSFGQLAKTPEFKEWQDREFQAGAADLNPEVGRRDFMKYMAASAALAGLSLSACRREEKTLVPFAQTAEWTIPGKPLFYATSRPHRRGAIPLVATTHDGRPTKVDGNPAHGTNKGATDLQTQASLLDAYDPDRSRRFQLDGRESTEADFTKWLAGVVEKAGDGQGIAFLTEHFTSPTYARLKKAVAAKLPKAMWVVYEPLGGSESGTAQEAAFGEGFRAVPQIDKADVILSLDCDFLGMDEGRLEGIRAFSARRKPEQKMNRLYVVENRYTTTGGMADHRLRSQAGKVGAVARAFAEKIAAATNDAALKAVVEAFPKVATDADAKWIEEAAKDLVAQKGKALVLVGYRQPAAVQALGFAINAALGALGETLVGRKTHGHGGGTTIADLTKALNDKQVKTLFILGGNPVYNAPGDLNFAAAIKNAEVVRHGFYEDETTYSVDVDEDGKVTKRNFVKWHVPAAHYLEAWGDGTASDGSHVSQQPMILPLLGGWSEIQLLNFILTAKKSEGLELVQETFNAVARGIDAVSWAKFLRDGFLPAAAPREPLAFNSASAAQLAAKYTAPAEGTEVVFAACPKVDDGRFSNNAWIQEMPDPVTKVTWDNAAIISPNTAIKLGLSATQGNGKFEFSNGAWITVEVGSAKLDVPVVIIPGTADDSITIALGYGRTHEGRVGGREGNYMSHGGLFAKKSQVGFNAYPLRTTANHYFAAAKVRKSEQSAYQLAITQEHGALEGRGPDVYRESTDPKFNARDKHWLHEKHAMDAHAEEFDAKGYPAARSAYSNPPLNDKNHQWAMAVDLSVCTGCSACMIACQSENNIPVVGKEQVIEGRELHWIRMDRYFVTPMNAREDKTIDFEKTRMVMQPMPCQHCENAPCETVCPVNATVHSDDGLNVMAYNRCIGTRYCANNCPFKVRRFNFFDFNERQKDKYFVPNIVNEKGMAETLKLSKNPNVTVRMRGVMEKCTFCVQRVQEAKIAAKVKAKDSSDVKVPTDAFKVACQQVCPTGAITFGNKLDAKSAVSRDIDNPRAYRVFDYLGIKPRVHYLARIMNPNPAMPDAPKEEKGAHA
ncbi:MAG: Tetrathionate reductase subunit precursor [Verrucomicrobiota bacterium]|jgi:molybdopterin-containing oxidoreductase family iron-sulfur binding subunit